ncbi:methyltransferase domain-containing protein [Streptomyces sp. LBUM 1476]|nr:methyltransferase domain-containing protein [Streptomyces sp. LBUM 1476]
MGLSPAPPRRDAERRDQERDAQEAADGEQDRRPAAPPRRGLLRPQGLRPDDPARGREPALRLLARRQRPGHVRRGHGPDDRRDDPPPRPGPGDRVLDVGCGNGTPALQLARARDVHVVGISVSARQVERGNRRAQEAGLADRVRFEQINAMDLPFEDGSFDRAWALESMLHMPDKRQVLAEMCRVVRPGARIPIADMVYLGPEAGRGPSVTVSDTHIYASLTDIEDYPDVIRAAGLSVLELTDITHETARTNDGYLDWIRAHRDEYVDIIGVEGYELIVHNQQALGRMPELGYIFATAQRPGP